ncbi:MAG: uracil phosphoribosyltransferase [Sandaracinaceae bacterium]
MASDVHVVDHPLVQHKLTLLRRRETSTSLFRQVLEETSMLLGYELTRDLRLERERIETPIEPMDAFVLAGKKVVVVSILRAGDGLLQGILRLIPSARVGHIGLYRDPATLEAVEYYFKMPRDLGDRDVLVVDPMLATGNSAAAAVARVKARGPRSVKFLCLLSAPEGIERFHGEHPDVPVYCAAIDERLNDQGYIVPGLGDAGDRLFGTK